MTTEKLDQFIPVLSDKLPQALMLLSEFRDLVGSTSGSSIGVWDNRDYATKLTETTLDPDGVETFVIPDSYFDKFGITREVAIGAVTAAKELVQVVDDKPNFKKYVDLMRRDR